MSGSSLALLRRVLLLALIATALPVLAQSDEAQPWLHEDTKRGGQVVLVEDHREPVVWITLAWPVGEASPWWLDNQMDLGWKLLVARDIARPASATRIRAWTSADAVGLDMACMADKLDDLIVELGRFRYKTWDMGKGRFRTRAWKRRQRRVQSKSPSWRLEKTLAGQFYQRGDPRLRNAKLRGGRPFTAAELSERLCQVFELDGWVAGFAGDLGPREAREAAARLFEGQGTEPLPEMQSSALLPLLDPSDTATQRVAAGRGGAAVLTLSRPGLTVSEPQAAAAILADEALAGMLRDELRTRLGYSYTVWTEGVVGPSPGVYTLGASAPPDDVEAIQAAALELLERVSTEGLPEAELQEARQRLAYQRLLRSQHPRDVMAAVVRAEVLPEGTTVPRSVLEAAEQATAEEVQNVTDTQFQPERFLPVLLAP